MPRSAGNSLAVTVVSLRLDVVMYRLVGFFIARFGENVDGSIG